MERPRLALGAVSLGSSTWDDLRGPGPLSTPLTPLIPPQQEKPFFFLINLINMLARTMVARTFLSRYKRTKKRYLCSCHPQTIHFFAFPPQGLHTCGPGFLPCWLSVWCTLRNSLRRPNWSSCFLELVIQVSGDNSCFPGSQDWVSAPESPGLPTQLEFSN